MHIAQDRGYAGCGLPRTPLLKLSEKCVEQRSNHEFGRYTEDEMGRQVPFRWSVGLGRWRVRDFRTVLSKQSENKGKRKGRDRPLAPQPSPRDGRSLLLREALVRTLPYFALYTTTS